MGLRVDLMTAVAVPLMAGGFLGCQRDPGATPDDVRPSNEPDVKLGLVVNEPKAYEGYTLVAPVKSKKTFLLDMQGRVVGKWESDTTPALGACLLENGHLLRT